MRRKKRKKKKEKKKGKLGTENATFISIQTLTISLCLVILSAKLVNLKQLYLSKQVLSGFNEPTQSKLVLCVLLKLYMYFI